MAEAAPYLFDRNFEPPKRNSDCAEAEEAAVKAKLAEEWERKMADACLKSFEEGQEAGRAEALQQLEAQTLEQVNILLECAQKIVGTVETECDQIRRTALEIATETANLLAGELIKRNPTLNIEALFEEALEHSSSAPHIAVTVNDIHAEKIQAATSKIANERGYGGKVIVVGDPETDRGDCTLQWADGGITLSAHALRSELETLVAKHIDRIAGPAPERTESEAEIKPNQPEPETETETGPGDTP